jgi:MFS family permease
MLITTRILAGAGGASVQTVGGGTMADIWAPKERGRVMAIYYLWPLLGPLLGSVIGGALANELGWRSTQWCMVILGGITTIGLILFLPETLTITKPFNSPRVGASYDRKTTRVSNILDILKSCLWDPLEILSLLRFPAVAVTVLYASVTFGTIYFINVAIEAAFTGKPYYFKPLILGLMYIPSGLGELCASFLGGPWIDSIMEREAKRKGRRDTDGNLVLIPEDRMKENAWIACVVFPCALIIFGWLTAYGVHFEATVSILFRHV